MDDPTEYVLNATTEPQNITIGRSTATILPDEVAVVFLVDAPVLLLRGFRAPTTRERTAWEARKDRDIREPA
ncbi:MAG: hypothetical protein ACRDGM_19335 [bacterium]